MTTPDPNNWLMSGGTASAKFPTVGTTVSGEIVAPPTVRPQTDLATGKPKTFDNGDPMLQLVVQVQTTERDPQLGDDDGVRAIYVKGQMQQAVKTAVLAAKAKGLEVGGVLSITYTGDGEAKQRGFSAPKLYSATYTAPTAQQAAAFLGTDQPAAAPAAPVDNSPEAFLRARNIDPATFGPNADLASIVALMKQTGAQPVG